MRKDFLSLGCGQRSESDGYQTPRVNIKSQTALGIEKGLVIQATSPGLRGSYGSRDIEEKVTGEQG